MLKRISISIIICFAVFAGVSFASAIYGKVSGNMPGGSGCYIGAHVDYDPLNYTNDPIDFSHIDTYQSHISRQLASTMWFQAWGNEAVNKFATASCEAAYARGSVPHIVWEPWNYSSPDTNYSLQKIIDGQFDEYILEWATDARDYGRPIFLRFAHEMNGNWYPWSGPNNGNDPSKYIAAWRHVHDVFSSVGADNVTWIWNAYSHSLPFESWNDANNYYPGDGYVDWIGISGYNWGRSKDWSTWQTFDDIFASPYNSLHNAHPAKPIMIAEFACSEVYDWVIWEKKGPWITDTFQKIKNSYPAVKAYNWFNVDKSGLGETNWHIESSDNSKNAMNQAMTDLYYKDRIFFPQVTVSEPHSGQRVRPGTEIGIVWSAVGTDSAIAANGISISYSLNGGNLYAAVATNLPNTGYYTWTVPETETDNAKIKITAVNELNNSSSFITDAFIVSNSIGTGHINVGFPLLAAGYTSCDWSFATFEGVPLIFNLQQTNLKSYDIPESVVANNLNGSVNVTKADIAGKRLAILNHSPDFVLYPGGTTSPFPSIWIKGDDINTQTGDSAPEVYLSGTDANKFYQTGFVINAPYYSLDDYQWTLYIFADRDILSQTPGPVSGKVLDPRTSTMRWFAWASYDNAGIPAKMWGIKYPGSSSPITFNTMPITMGSGNDLKQFLIAFEGTSLPETDTWRGELSGYPESSIPADGNLYYNTDRNTQFSDNANGLQIVGRSQAGLVYASPDGPLCHRTEKIHMQFIVVYSQGMGFGQEPKSCEVNIYQRVAP